MQVRALSSNHSEGRVSFAWVQCLTQDLYEVVYPDLPPTMNPFKQFTSGKKNVPSQKHDVSSLGRPILTIAAQFRRKGEIDRLMQEAAMPCNPNNAAQALLLVSGGHVLREISSPFFGSQMMSSFDMLRSARHLREIGSINKSTGLWAVENPLTNHPERLEQKLEAGAEAVITQPPVLWEKFEQWWMHSVQRGLIGSTSDLKVIVGLPVIGSLRTLEFWQKLTKTQHSPESKRLLFNLSESIGKGNEDVLYEWNRDLALKVKALPGVSGAHIMPLNQAGVAQTRRLIEENII